MFKMLKHNLKIILCLLALAIPKICLGGEMASSVGLAADVPQQNSLTVTVSKVTGSTWSTATSLEFGNLIYDEKNRIFSAESYYVIDVAINSNSHDWTVTHVATSITNGIESLDNNINVSFLKQQDAGAGTTLVKLSYADSRNKSFKKADLSEGWLRVYYGLATGDSKTDAPGTTPVVPKNNAGNYRGNISFTLTPA